MSSSLETITGKPGSNLVSRNFIVFLISRDRTKVNWTEFLLSTDHSTFDVCPYKLQYRPLGIDTRNNLRVRDCLEASHIACTTSGFYPSSSGFGYKWGAVFDRKYQVVCPLPSSKGPPSKANSDVAKTMAATLNHFPQVLNLIVRHRPMHIKSTELDRSTRARVDAAKLIHYDNISVDPLYVKDIKGMSILLYDDVFNWGNTSARNLLLLLGAAEVDVLTCFSTGPVFRATTYGCSLDSNDIPSVISDPLKMSKDLFSLTGHTLVEKEFLKWPHHQETMKQWHDLTLQYIQQKFPEFVPNDIPW